MYFENLIKVFLWDATFARIVSLYAPASIYAQIKAHIGNALS